MLLQFAGVVYEVPLVKTCGARISDPEVTKFAQVFPVQSSTTLFELFHLIEPEVLELGLCAVVPLGIFRNPVPLIVVLPDTVKSPVTEFKLIAVFDAEVTNPCALTVTAEMFDEPPYVPAVTPVFAILVVESEKSSISEALMLLFAIEFVVILDNGMALFILYSV